MKTYKTAKAFAKDYGVSNLDLIQVNPLDQFGSPLEIVKLFGGKKQYLQAITELEQEIYKVA